MCDIVSERRPETVVVLHAPSPVETRALDRPLTLVRVVPERVVFVEGHTMLVNHLVLSVMEPVVDLKLNPRRSQVVQDGGRDELLAAEKAARQRPRVGVHQSELPRCLADTLRWVDVTREPVESRAHLGLVEIVARPVGGASSLAGPPVSRSAVDRARALLLLNAVRSVTDAVSLVGERLLDRAERRFFASVVQSVEVV